MIGEMFLGILISFAIWAISAGVMYWLTYEIDLTFGLTFLIGSLANAVVGGFLPCNVQASLFSFCGACIIAFLLGLLIWLFVDRFDNADFIALICAIVILIGSYFGFWYLHLCNTDQDPYSRNIVKIEEPVVTETKYEILGGSDTTRISGYVYGGIYYTRGSSSENSYFKVYIPCKNSDGETVVMPYTMRESDVTVILMPTAEAGPEYLLQTVTTYYKEDRNKEPAELLVDKRVVTNKLYVNESTFSGMKIDGD